MIDTLSLDLELGDSKGFTMHKEARRSFTIKGDAIWGLRINKGPTGHPYPFEERV